MARPLRIEFAGGLYHVTSRGDRREDIFLDDRSPGVAGVGRPGMSAIQLDVMPGA